MAAEGTRLSGAEGSWRLHAFATATGSIQVSLTGVAMGGSETGAKHDADAGPDRSHHGTGSIRGYRAGREGLTHGFPLIRNRSGQSAQWRIPMRGVTSISISRLRGGSFTARFPCVTSTPF